jgi:hypothetical protein
MPDDNERNAREPWLNEWDTGGLWEYQVHPLTVGSLLAALKNLPADLPVTVEQYDPSGRITDLRPVHIDATGTLEQATGIIITVT